MRNLFRSLVIILFGVSGALAQEQSTGSPERGYQAFMKYQCYTCHGTIGHGADRGVGPRLAPNPLPYDSFSLQVRRPRQDMPAYRKEFVSDQELADIYAYLKSVKGGPAVKEIPLLNF